jgi:hypothetical protein
MCDKCVSEECVHVCHHLDLPSFSQPPLLVQPWLRPN